VHLPNLPKITKGSFYIGFVCKICKHGHLALLYITFDKREGAAASIALQILVFRPVSWKRERAWTSRVFQPLHPRMSLAGVGDIARDQENKCHRKDYLYAPNWDACCANFLSDGFAGYRVINTVARQRPTQSPNIKTIANKPAYANPCSMLQRPKYHTMGKQETMLVESLSR
jgi:hypothetical protein